MPYTLLDQDVLDDIFPRCEEQEVQVVIGAPFASGILATGAVDGATYDYAPATAAILKKTQAIQQICERHGTPLQAAALQFPVAHPLVVAAIPGATEAAHVRANVDNYSVEIPADLWAELKKAGVLRADAPTPISD
jgi:D-threo-aldose 1-dehydrogenase